MRPFDAYPRVHTICGKFDQAGIDTCSKQPQHIDSGHQSTRSWLLVTRRSNQPLVSSSPKISIGPSSGQKVNASDTVTHLIECLLEYTWQLHKRWIKVDSSKSDGHGSFFLKLGHSFLLPILTTIFTSAATKDFFGCGPMRNLGILVSAISWFSPLSKTGSGFFWPKKGGIWPRR